MNDLINRICNGYTWLIEHPDDPHYPEALKLYEELVDEARKQGIKEKDCWPVTIEDASNIFNIDK